MKDIDALFALTDAADSCHTWARQFIEDFRKPRELSAFSDGSPTHAAPWQARDHVERIRMRWAKSAIPMHQWDENSMVLCFVGMAVGFAKPITIAGRTYHTAHEAARYFAETVSDQFTNAEGYDDEEWFTDLASRLSALSIVEDLSGRIQGEHYAALDLLSEDTAGLTPVQARNKFCFEQDLNDKTYKEINTFLKRHPTWDAYPNELSVRSAIKSWAKHIGATRSTRKPGRPTKS